MVIRSAVPWEYLLCRPEGEERPAGNGQDAGAAQGG